MIVEIYRMIARIMDNTISKSHPLVRIYVWITYTYGWYICTHIWVVFICIDSICIASVPWASLPLSSDRANDHYLDTMSRIQPSIPPKKISKTTKVNTIGTYLASGRLGFFLVFFFFFFSHFFLFPLMHTHTSATNRLEKNPDLKTQRAKCVTK